MWIVRFTCSTRASRHQTKTLAILEREEYVDIVMLKKTVKSGNERAARSEVKWASYYSSPVLASSEECQQCKSKPVTNAEEFRLVSSSWKTEHKLQWIILTPLVIFFF